ncbi:hypothetical protein GCM10022225_76970 [Plantactinospora mayteni]|uniref:Transposase n=1 Tax=Plantactinospora mayteni TaxID=566021 RepID=A0ABQ4F2J9_9ACTN|nr:hypothetical protein [Plantactinospora mayteni]GIH01130.1 hypothetical protein Pma05_77020 [Plantactinospora mayteni]
MTQPPPLTDTDVRAALDAMHRETATTGRRPSVLGLAQRLGLPNTTLRRRFPEICAELTPGHTTPAASPATDVATIRNLRRDNARLRRDNHNLTANLEVAIANIQQLTLEVHQLREALEHARNVTRLPRPPR